MRKKLIVITISVFLIFSLFTGIIEAGSGTDEIEPTYIRFGTGMATGTWYVTGAYLGKVLEEKCPLLKGVTVQVTAGTLENANLLETEELEIAFINGNILYNAHNGLPPYKEKSFEKANAIMFGQASAWQWIVLKNSKIERIEDLKGKRVATGAAGSGIVTVARKVLNLYGISPEDIDERFLTYKEGLNALKDGKIDCVFVAAYYPLGIVDATNVSHPIRLLSMEKEKVNEFIQKNPPIYSRVIPANTYKGVDYPVTVLDSGTLICVGSWLPDELVYQILKTIYENLDELGEQHPILKTLNFDWDPNTLHELVGLHPGAIRFYKEIGKMK